MKIAFGIMSAVHSARVVDQLASCLRPYEVFIHHDFAQQSPFELTTPGVRYVPQPKRTGWGVWGFTEGVFHLLRHCLRNSDFEYFQLLSPTCLPIKPVAQFEQALTQSRAQANIESIALASDRDALMNYGMRAYAPHGSLRYRMMKRAFLVYYGANWQSAHRANLQLRHSGDSRRPVLESASVAVMKLAQRGYFGRNLLTHGLSPHVGGTWFGARRDICEYLVRRFEDNDVQECFSRIFIADEMILASLIADAPIQVGPSNHLVNRFTEGNPNWLLDTDYSMLEQSDRFFARKFPDDPDAPIRHRVMTELAGRVEHNTTIQRGRLQQHGA